VADEAGLTQWVNDKRRRTGAAWTSLVANVSAPGPSRTSPPTGRPASTRTWMGTVRPGQRRPWPYLERSDAASIVTIASVSGPGDRLSRPGPRTGTFKAAIHPLHPGGWPTSWADKGIRAQLRYPPGNNLLRRRCLAEHRAAETPTCSARPWGLKPDRPGWPGRRKSARAAVFPGQPGGQLHEPVANLLVDGALDPRRAVLTSGAGDVLRPDRQPGSAAARWRARMAATTCRAGGDRRAARRPPRTP